ncbi:hypothetical protein FRB94_002671 [Tulasnella sp. JGI-2019a]|nr:hypothetical protein FRB93_002099 [Tulasnella sp. JGI-2019a]KAG9004080.1 hypothetical protein FRB94_002671 [Tulasnella sp. JGI-2019a]
MLAQDANQSFYYIPEAQSSSPWLNWSSDYRTTGWCLSPPRITQKADMVRQRSTDGLNMPEVWERNRDVEIVEGLGDGTYLYVGTFWVVEEPLPKMDLLGFENLSSETQFAVRERIGESSHLSMGISTRILAPNDSNANTVDMKHPSIRGYCPLRRGNLYENLTAHSRLYDRITFTSRRRTSSAALKTLLSILWRRE